MSVHYQRAIVPQFSVTLKKGKKSQKLSFQVLGAGLYVLPYVALPLLLIYC